MESKSQPVLCPVGKEHKGKDIEEVPSQFLRYLLETPWFDQKFPEVAKAMDAELAYRDKWDKHF